MSNLEIGQDVTVSSHGHRKDGQTGTVTYYSKFMGTWGVKIDGHDYGFFANELTANEAAA